MNKHIADVLIPAHNESGIIAKTIVSIASQQIDKQLRFTVHIIANGCTDDTVERARQAIAEISGNKQMSFRMHVLSKASKIGALNHGLRCATAPFVFCVDADVVLSKNCFAETLAAFEDKEVMVAGPLPQLIVSRRNCKGLLGQIQRTANLCNRMYECTTPNGCMIAYRRELVDKYPAMVAADDTWVSFMAIHKFGWKAVRVTRAARAFVVGPQHWLDYFKQESRFSRTTRQLIEVFPEFGAVRKAQIKRVKQLARQNLTRIKAQAKKERIKLIYVKQRRLLQQICEENAELMAAQLVTLDGHWETISTTKQTPAEQC